MSIEIDEQEDQLAPQSSLRDYLDHALRRKWIIVICLIVPLAVAFAVGSTRHKLYQGNAQVVLSRQNLANALTGIPDPASTTREFQRIVTTQSQIARSEGLAQKVAAAVPEAHTNASTLLSALTVSASRDANLVLFHVSGPDAVIAARLAAEYARQFVAFRHTLDGTSLNEALRTLESQLAPLRRDPVRNAALIDQLTTQRENLRTLLALQTTNAVAIPTPTSSDEIGTSSSGACSSP